MKNILLIMVILICSISSCYDKKQESAEWNIIEVRDKNFEVLLPFSNYKTREDTLYLEKYGIVYNYAIELNTQDNNHENLSYTVNYYEYPQVVFDTIDIDYFFEGSIKNILNTINSSNLYVAKINYKGYPWKRIVLL